MNGNVEYVRSVSDVVLLIEKRRSERNNILFRGHRRDWDLVPGIARLEPRGSLPDVEQRMLKKFKRESLPYLEMRPESDLDWLAVAQHYGLPTRLLDWSLNALTSLWFAVTEPPVGHDPGVLWVLTPKGDHYITKRRETNPFTIKRSRVLVPKYISKRIVSQGGYFTVHKSTHGGTRFPALQEDDDFRGHLVKVLIPPELFPCFRYDLYRLGIHHLTVFPDLGGLCNHIRYFYFRPPDEAQEWAWGPATDHSADVSRLSARPGVPNNQDIIS